MSLKTAISVYSKNYLPLLGPFGFNMWAEISYCLIRFNVGKKNLHSGRSFASEVGVHLFQEVNMPFASERLAPAKQTHFDILQKVL